MEHKLGVYFQGWLMHQLPDEIATTLHHSTIKPYSISVRHSGNTVIFTVSLLGDEMTRHVEPILLNEDLKAFTLSSSKQKEFKVQKIQIETLTQAELSKIFYQDSAPKHYRIKFLSATSFKEDGEYIMFPDLKLLLQSLMQKYNVIFEKNNHVDQDLLNDLILKTRIVNYRLQSSYYPVHKSFIPGFLGEIKIACYGNQTLRNYLNMLLTFGSYSGVGIKTTMGMGTIECIKVKKGVRNGS